MISHKILSTVVLFILATGLNAQQIKSPLESSFYLGNQMPGAAIADLEIQASSKDLLFYQIRTMVASGAVLDNPVGRKVIVGSTICFGTS